jgi:hypothetical protein
MKPRHLLLGLLLSALAGCSAVPGAPELVAVEFFTDPPGAEVWVDDALAGQTPVTKSYAWAKENEVKQVVFKMDGYFAEKRFITENTAVIAVQLREALEMLARDERRSAH